MFHIFGNKDSKESSGTESAPDLDLLNGNCYECDFCQSVHSLIDAVPLSVTKCSNCGASNFIPYLLKHYWLYKPLGGGGMGAVYKAVHHSNPKWEFAVKVLPRKKKNDPHLIEALLREASIGKKFGRHPHLVEVADYGKYNDEHFAALEFTYGRRLDQIIDQGDPINQKYVLLWALQLLSAEQRIWESGYLYRDMKPQNIMIDPKGNAVLFDYGLCQAIEQSNDPSSDMVDGSPLYMPPERIVGMTENKSSEIYSIGMVLFHALTRKTYYTSTGAYELAKKHVASLRISSVATRLPVSVNPLIAPLLDKMVARVPAQRFQDFKDVAVAIKHIYDKL
ncbi:MAG: serine/threonine protein kinase [Victivallales bacterium]|nr:serine/threonine protein kinase [Victivallales bacterium]